jgi:insecticidal toxin complex protein TccC
MTRNVHHNTPSVTVSDNRGLTVRTLAWLRHPDAPPSQPPDILITRHQYDARGSLTRSADPRLHDAGRVNFTYLSDLNGSVLRTEGADSGTALTLNDAAGRPFLTVTAPGTPECQRQDIFNAFTILVAAILQRSGRFLPFHLRLLALSFSPAPLLYVSLSVGSFLP